MTDSQPENDSWHGVKDEESNNNWMAWKSCIMQTLHKNWISGFPHGEFLAPNWDTDSAEYDTWDRIDQAIIQYIKANINNDQLISIPEFLEINSSGHHLRCCSRHGTSFAKFTKLILLKWQTTSFKHLLRHALTILLNILLPFSDKLAHARIFQKKPMQIEKS